MSTTTCNDAAAELAGEYLPERVSGPLTSGRERQDIAQRFSQRCEAERYRDRFARGRHRRTHARETTALRRLLRRIEPLDTILDVASGAGRFVPLFAEHARIVLQTDFSIHMLHVSSESYDVPKTGGHVQADARLLPFAAGSCDLVFCHRLLNHLPREEDRATIIRCMSSVSRRFVTLSCLAPPAPLRALRRFHARLRGRQSIDGFVEVKDLIRTAARIGLRVVERTSIRAGFRSAAFLTFEKNTSDGRNWLP